MTNREFYTAIVNSDLSDELKAFATEAIEKLDARNAKRANTLSKTQKDNLPLIEKIASLLTSEPKLASELAKEMEISTQKASALVKKVEGVSVCDVKVKGKGTQKGYYFAQPKGLALANPFSLRTYRTYVRAGRSIGPVDC